MLLLFRPSVFSFGAIVETPPGPVGGGGASSSSHHRPRRISRRLYLRKKLLEKKLDETSQDLVLARKAEQVAESVPTATEIPPELTSFFVRHWDTPTPPPLVEIRLERRKLQQKRDDLAERLAQAVMELQLAQQAQAAEDEEAAHAFFAFMNLME